MTDGLAFAELSDALVLPFREPLVAPPPVGFHGGPVLGPEHDALRHTRYWQPVDVAYAPDEPAVELGGSHAYAGPVFGHFGHYLSEMVHRFVPTSQHGPVDRWLMVGVALTERPTVDSLPVFVHAVLDYLGIERDSVEVVHRPVRVGRLAMSEQGSDFGGGPRTGYVDLLREVNDRWWHGYRSDHPTRTTAERVYVSRSASLVGGLLGERYLEACLGDEGFAVVRPERLPFDEQMAVYRSARTLLFCEGSAIHGTELMGSGSLGRVGMISRRGHHDEIFRRVLEPRADSYAAASCATHLGTALRYAPTGDPLPHWGVSVVDPVVLRARLMEAGLATMRTFSEFVYLAAARADLEEYVRTAHHDLGLRDPLLGADLIGAFDAWCADLPGSPAR